MAPVRPILGFAHNNLRNFSTSSVCYAARNFRKIVLHGFRGTMRFKERQRTNPDPDIPVYDYGVRQPGYTYKGKFHVVPELVPELIVPDLTNFKLRPYVSYKVDDVQQDEFTARDLFNAIYAEKIMKDFKANSLDENGNPLEPNEYEKLTAEESKIKARQCGSDYFNGTPPSDAEMRDY